MNMKGYYKQPELTAQTMSGGYVYTNDEGYIDEAGFVYVLGRRDDVINYKGIKIAPDEIEAAAMRFPGVRDCACVPMPDPVAGQVPKLFVAAADPDSFDRKALMRFLQEHLEPERMPAKCELIGEIPRTFNGKIQRKSFSRTSRPRLFRPGYDQNVCSSCREHRATPWRRFCGTAKERRYHHEKSA